MEMTSIGTKAAPELRLPVRARVVVRVDVAAPPRMVGPGVGQRPKRETVYLARSGMGDDYEAARQDAMVGVAGTLATYRAQYKEHVKIQELRVADIRRLKATDRPGFCTVMQSLRVRYGRWKRMRQEVRQRAGVCRDEPEESVLQEVGRAVELYDADASTLYALWDR